MNKIIEALQTTHNTETYMYKLNNIVNLHITKMDIWGKRFLVETEVNGRILKGEYMTADQAINL